jgi:parallel beta-helix repeat protein
LNTIINNGAGIHLRNSNSNTIIDNNLSSNNYSIFLNECDDNTLTRNNVSNNGAGIGFIASNNNTIAYNKINANNYYGLWFIGGQYNIICNNIISKSRDGINLQTDNNMFKNNSISNNECGIYLTVCSSNTIQKNNFLDNELDVDFFSIFIVSLLKRNIWKENYWNRPRILPKIIFGRASFLGRHVFPWINFDWYPAKEPYDIEVVI